VKTIAADPADVTCRFLVRLLLHHRVSFSTDPRRLLARCLSERSRQIVSILKTYLVMFGDYPEKSKLKHCVLK